MTSNNKILTVSYGTFSCTLEGFDDAFGTMKAIAEYFRTLAAEDRYFGAEPPTPDADMLALIAQKESARRVEAHEKDGAIVLSEVDAPAQASDAHDLAPSNEREPGTARSLPAGALAAAAVLGAQQGLPTDQPVDADEPSETEELSTPDDPKPEAEKATPELQSEEASEEPAEPEAAPTTDAQAPEAEEAQPPEAEEAAPEPQGEEAPVAKEEAPAEDEAASDSPEEAAEPKPLTRAEVKAARKAKRRAKRRAKRAARRQAEAEAKEKADAKAERQDPPETDIVPSVPDDTVEAFFAEGTEAPADVETDNEALADTDAASDESIADKLKRIRAVVSQHQTDDSAESYEEGADADGAADQQDTLVADTLRDIQEAFDTDDKNETAGYAVPEPKPAAPRARVMKVKKADLEKAIESGQLEEYSEPGAEPSSLNDADEAELQRDLDILKAELEETNPKPVEAGAAPIRDKGGDRAKFDDQAENDLSRLMDKAKSQMDEPESATRRDAFTHLRAAVAAKKADDAIGDRAEVANDDAYREDLANVVHSTNTAETPAPLKLVAEQRVDVKDKAPIQPRRVAVESKPEPADADSFSEYAESVGATKLPDLLEAAASYMAHVEGQSQFSRPQLMTKVRQVKKEEYSREDGLRSFGKLLRDGKIEKIKGGRFQVSDEIGFKPNNRAAG